MWCVADRTSRCWMNAPAPLASTLKAKSTKPPKKRVSHCSPSLTDRPYGKSLHITQHSLSTNRKLCMGNSNLDGFVEVLLKWLHLSDSGNSIPTFCSLTAKVAGRCRLWTPRPKLLQLFCKKKLNWRPILPQCPRPGKGSR